MNTDTGRIYRGEAEIEAARQRGEPLVEVSERVAQLVEAGQYAARLANIRAKHGLNNTRYKMRKAQARRDAIKPCKSRWF